MLATILYPDSCSAPPWATLTPHTLLQLLMGLRNESLKRLLLEQTAFGNFWPVMMLLSLQLWIQGQCHPNSLWGKGLRASLTQQLWSLLCGLLLHWAGLSSPHTPSSPCCCHSSTPPGEAAEEESAGAMQRAKVHGGVSSTTAANKLQAASSPHGHSLPIPITPKSQA